MPNTAVCIPAGCGPFSAWPSTKWVSSVASASARPGKAVSGVGSSAFFFNNMTRTPGKHRPDLYGASKGACPYGHHALISPSRRSAPDGSAPDASGLQVEWTGGRVVEGARLERVYRGNSIEGSNPSLSATVLQALDLKEFVLKSVTYNRWGPNVCYTRYGESRRVDWPNQARWRAVFYAPHHP